MTTPTADIVGPGLEVDPLKVAVIKETAPGERRVALVPESVARLAAAGCEVLVESGAGGAAWLPDEAYTKAGAAVVPAEALWTQADVVLCVRPLTEEAVARLHSGQVVIGMLAPLTDPAQAQRLADLGVTAVSLDGLPRTLSSAQGMDALSSQASVAGYRSVLLAADTFGRYLPMMVTAAGTARPAELLVLGVGVAGLQAIATARRLGAIVRGYDVRPDSKTEVASLGATFLELTSVSSGQGEGGYARALTADEQAAQQAELNDHIARHDIVITTAQVPGRRPPLLVTAKAVEKMKAGSVIVDMAASPLGGNVELSQPGETIVTPNGVTIVGADNLPSSMPTGASAAYSRNISALLLHLQSEGGLRIDLDDEIQAGVVITHAGAVVHKAVAGLLATPSAPEVAP